MTSLIGKDEWLRPSYYVQPLPPTLELIKWSYGSQREEDEHEYIQEKMKMSYVSINGEQSKEGEQDEVTAELQFLTTLIKTGQSLIRKYGSIQLMRLNPEMKEDEARCFSNSCVSQRDIQRVFILYEWLLKWFKASNHYNNETETSRRVRATYVAIGRAYYFRLSFEFREKFEEEMKIASKDHIGEEVDIRFSDALQNELDLMMQKFKLPQQISDTQALKENIYVTIVCIVNKIPLIIVGPPGSSKTLTIKLVSSHLKGINAEAEIFQNEDLFPPLDLHSYQCSRRSTSNEIEAIFKRAINRKKLLDEVAIKNCSVVVMDEAGLTEKSHESLKVLHYYLDTSKVRMCSLEFLFQRFFPKDRHTRLNCFLLMCRCPLLP